MLARIAKWTKRHKIQDKWEQEEYVVVSQPDPFLPVYKVRPISGGSTRTLHMKFTIAFRSTDEIHRGSGLI